MFPIQIILSHTVSAWPVAVGDSFFARSKKNTVAAFHGLSGFTSESAKNLQPFVPGELYFTPTDATL
jgi:hypothetical protein